jgi:LysM repeat protein
MPQNQGVSVKKMIFSPVAVCVMLIAISCKTVPAVTEQEAANAVPEPIEQAAFVDAYQAVLPLIIDNAEYYMVKSGDTLTRIARTKYGRGNAFFFPLIMAASNGERLVDIVDPDNIEPGMELIIPNLEENCTNPEIRGRLKTLLLSVSEIYEKRPETRWSSEMISGLTTAAQDL